MPTGGLKSILDKVRDDISKANQPSLNFKTIPATFRDQKARTGDKIDDYLHIWINDYIKKQLQLKESLSKKILFLLKIEIIGVFLLVISSGLKWIELEQWLVALIFNIVILQTFGLVLIIVKNVFPSEDKILENLGNMRERK
jgi:hypothetical protein